MKVFDPIIKQCVNNWAHCESTPKCSEDRQVLADPDDINAFFVCKSPPGPLNPGFIVQKGILTKNANTNQWNIII